MRALRAIAPLFATMIALTACSDGGGLDPDEEAELLEDAILTEDDLPDGFVEAEPDDNDEEDFEDCLEEVDVDPDALEDATVADEGPVAFEQETDEAFASVEVELRSVEDTEVVEDLIEAMGEEDFIDCLEEASLEDAEEEDQQVEDLTLEEIDPVVDGDASGALRFTGDFAGFEIVADLHVVLVGDHLIRMETVALEGSLDEDDVEEAIDTMIERLEEAS